LQHSFASRPPLLVLPLSLLDAGFIQLHLHSSSDKEFLPISRALAAVHQ
jgi:hypothetical protein